VLNYQDEPIIGLYAAGEAGAGILGPRYAGGGNAVTMGRSAARTARQG
jgi:hypothetical protein